MEMAASREYKAARSEAETFYNKNRGRIEYLVRYDKEPEERDALCAEYMRLKLIEKTAYEKLYGGITND